MFTEHCLVINLESRPDRWAHAQTELASVGITPVRFDAIVGVVKGGFSGAIGCSESHLACLELAQESNWPHVCIVEDDITFTNPALFKSQMETFKNANMEWDVLLIGGVVLPPMEHVPSAACVKVSHSQTTTGYIVQKHYYATLIANFRKGIEMLRANRHLPNLYAVDMYWIRLQKMHNWFILFPLTITQYANYSDIEQRHVNYEAQMVPVQRVVLPPQPTQIPRFKGRMF